MVGNSSFQNKSTVDRSNPSVVIIGAGMTGLLVAIKLQEMGVDDVVLLESRPQVGGTWYANTYPGVACDIPCYGYTYEFEPNPDWSSLLPKGEEIQRYFERVFKKYGLAAKTHFNEAVTACHYNDQSRRWQLTTAKGNHFEADLVFSATGILREPARPAIAGMENFQGPIFHTAEWDHRVDLKGKRIGCIGTSSTAVQAIPELLNLPGTEVSVFQRTAQWMIPVDDIEFSAQEKARMRRFPRWLKWRRDVAMWFFRQAMTAITNDGWLDRLKHRALTRMAQKHLDTQVSDPALRAKLTPNYTFGCKRMIINTTFYPAIQKPNAHLVTEAIDHFTDKGIVTRDGEFHELDVVVLATGFNPMAFMRPMAFTGRGGQDINDTWEKKIQAYRSILLPGFPNFFLMLGPYTPIGNYSVIAMSEVQTRYAMQLVERWRSGEMDTIEATQEAMQHWQQSVKSRLGRTAWASGCNSWYLDADGDPLSWPDTWNAWVKAMAKPDLKDFVNS